MDTPFTNAAEREQAWIYYYSWLQKQIDESLFNETFSLSQIYVPLRAYCEQKSEKDELLPLEPVRHSRTTRVVVDATTELDAWIDRADHTDRVRVIGGGPGCGKSSFTKMYAAHATGNSNIRVLYIPLHQFDAKADLCTALGDFIRSAQLLPHNPLHPDSREERLLILFDGLDELAMQGRAGAEVARGFVEEVIKHVDNTNHQKICLQVLITGREIVIQANAVKFRKDCQVLHMLPYFIADGEETGSGDGLYDDPKDLLKVDQRDLWWKQYGDATGKSYSALPEELSREDLVDITAQPLLNFLVALSFVRGILDFSTPINLNEIYEDLLEAVHGRAYATTGTLPGISDIKLTDFIRILEEIGLAAWRGDGRTTTILEIQRRCESGGLSKLFATFKEGAEAGVAQLLTAFYFRQHGERRDGEPSFEFTHKSFGEYLIARRLVRALDKILNEYERHFTSPDDGWVEAECLKHWAELFIDSPRMTSDLYRFVASEIMLKPKPLVIRLQKTLSLLISFLLQHGTPKS